MSRKFFDIGEKMFYRGFMKENGAISRAVVLLGGSYATASRIGSSYQAVWYWLNGHRKISPRFALEIERQTNGVVTREQLRPDIYPPRAA